MLISPCSRLFAVWSNAPPNTKTSAVANILNITGESLGNHFFVPNPVTNVGVSPEWDFRNLKRDLLTAGQPSPNAQSGPDTGEAFIVAAGEGTLAAPTGPEDINWLQVKNAGVKQNMDGKEFQGRLADVVYRTDTVSFRLLSSSDYPLTLSFRNAVNHRHLVPRAHRIYPWITPASIVSLRNPASISWKFYG